MKAIHFSFPLMLLIVLFGCAYASNEITLTDSDQGKVINAAPNQTIALRLESNHTTGFKWNLVTEPDAKILKLVSSEYTSPGGPPGAGGTELWKFQAVGAGTTTLKLGYFRPFEPKNVAKEFPLTITVR